MQDITDHNMAKMESQVVQDITKMETKSEQLITLLGENLIRRKAGETEERVKVETLFGPNKTLGIYFAAHWCPPCIEFTKTLETFFQDFNKGGGDFQIVFVSSDRDVTNFNKGLKDMPWLALPYGERNRKEMLCKKLKVKRIPTLMIIDGKTGDVINHDATSNVISDPTRVEFPWREKSLSEMLSGNVLNSQKEQRDIASAMKGKVTGFYFPKEEETVEYKEAKMKLNTLKKGDITETKAFCKPPECVKLVMDALCILLNQPVGWNQAKKVLAKLDLIEDLKNFDKDDIPMEILDKLETYVNNRELQYERVCNVSLAASGIWFWIAAVYKYARSRTTSKPRNKCLMSTVPRFQPKAITHSTDPLIKMYNKMKTDGKNFEIVSVNPEQDEKVFNESLATMPWFALPYGDKRIKDLTQRFDIEEGNQALVLVNEEGNVINKKGLAAILADVNGEDFPWKPKPFNKLTAEIAEMINEETCLVLFTGDTSNDIEHAEEVLGDVGNDEIAKGDNQELICFYVGSGLKKKLMDYAGLSFKSKRGLAILDVLNNKTYKCPDGDITKKTVAKFVTQYQSGDLKAVHIRPA